MIIAIQVLSFIVGFVIGYLLTKLGVHVYKKFKNGEWYIRKPKPEFVNEYDNNHAPAICVGNIKFVFDTCGYIYNEDHTEKRRLWIRFKAYDNVDMASLTTLYKVNDKYSLEEMGEDLIACNGVIYTHYMKDLRTYFVFDEGRWDENDKAELTLTLCDKTAFGWWKKDLIKRKKKEDYEYDIAHYIIPQ